MIVVDTNIITYLLLPSKHTEQAERLLEHDINWAAPLLWRSEFRSVLTLYLRKQLINFEQAVQLQEEAEALMQNNEYESNSIDVLSVVTSSNCSAYDCEFVALAKTLKTQMITMDKQILREFPETAVSLVSYF